MILHLGIVAYQSGKNNRYTNQFSHKRDNIDGFLTAEEPLDIMCFLEINGKEKNKTEGYL